MPDNVIYLCHICHRKKSSIAIKDKKTGETSWYCKLCWDSTQNIIARRT